MPVTAELKNAKKFESAGFTHEQSETLAETIEQAQVNGQEVLKEFIHSEIKDLRAEFNSKIDNVQNTLTSKIDNVQNTLNNKIEKILNVTDNIDTHIKAGQYDLLIKIFAIVVGSLTVAVTILKLFP